MYWIMIILKLCHAMFMYNRVLIASRPWWNPSLTESARVHITTGSQLLSAALRYVSPPDHGAQPERLESKCFVSVIIVIAIWIYLDACWSLKWKAGHWIVSEFPPCSVFSWHVDTSVSMVSCYTSVCCSMLQCQGRRKRHRSSKVPLGDLRCETNRWHQVTLIDTSSWAIDNTYWHFVFFSNLFKLFNLSWAIWAIWAKVRLATDKYAQSLTVWGAAENTSKIEDQGTDIRHQKSNAGRCTSWIMHRHSDGP